MPQEFHVLQCHKCETFQVHQVKKTNKWNCKLCGEKQSVIKVFGRGSGADCRHHVQRLNQLRGDIITVKEQINTYNDLTQNEIDNTHNPQCDTYNRVQESTTDSKWTRFLNIPEVNVTDSEDNDDEFTTNKEKYLAAQKMKSNRKRKFNNESMKNSLCKRQNENTIDDYNDHSEYGVIQTTASQLKNNMMFNGTDNDEPWIWNQSNGCKRKCKTSSKWEQYVHVEETSSTVENSEKICNKEFDDRLQIYNNDQIQNMQLKEFQNRYAEKEHNKTPEASDYNTEIELKTSLERSTALNKSDIRATRECEIPSLERSTVLNKSDIRATRECEIPSLERSTALNKSDIRATRECEIPSLERSTVLNKSDIRATRECEVPSKYENKTQSLGLKVCEKETLCYNTAANLPAASVSIFSAGDITEADLELDI